MSRPLTSPPAATAFLRTSDDPSRAAIEFYWRGMAAEPGSFFPERGEEWFWPGDGIRLDDRLFIFLTETHRIIEDYY